MQGLFYAHQNPHLLANTSIETFTFKRPNLATDYRLN